MPRRLLLMRHARQGGSASSDHERALTEAGREDARRVGRRLRDRGEIPGRVLRSTARRCHETWEAMAEAFDPPVADEPDRALYNASASELLDAIAGVPDEVDSLLVLAHNPGISLLALALAGDREGEAERLHAGFAPATTAAFEVADDWSTLSARSARLVRFEHA